MLKLKVVKILFFVSALAFIARPFFGFILFDRQHHPAEDSILVKIFSKRKPELSEDGSVGSAIEKQLADPGLDISPRFGSFLDILFPNFPTVIKTSSVTMPAAAPPPACQTWLLCGKILI